jgi:hypothetical protein
MVKEVAQAAYQQDPSPDAWHLDGCDFDASALPQQANAKDYRATPGGVLPTPAVTSEIRLWQCANQGDAKAALRDIGLQGEGPAQGPPAGETSHFERFYAIYVGAGGYLPFPKKGDWVPTYDVPIDPVISDDGEDPRAISAPQAQDYATLGNLRYALVLGLLGQYLVTDPDLRKSLKLANWAINEMLRLPTLSARLVGLPRSKSHPGGGVAALPFTLPCVLKPPIAKVDQWGLLIDRLEAVIDQESLIIGRYNDQDLKRVLDEHKTQLDLLKQQLPKSQKKSGEMATKFDDVKQILENAVHGDSIGAHGNFWRTTRDQFVALVLFQGTPREKPVLALGDGKNSNLIKALRGQAPFNGTYAPRMPDGYPPVPADQIGRIEQWIDAGCP